MHFCVITFPYQTKGEVVNHEELSLRQWWHENLARIWHDTDLYHRILRYEVCLILSSRVITS